MVPFGYRCKPNTALKHLEMMKPIVSNESSCYTQCMKITISIRRLFVLSKIATNYRYKEPQLVVAGIRLVLGTSVNRQFQFYRTSAFYHPTDSTAPMSQQMRLNRLLPLFVVPML